MRLPFSLPAVFSRPTVQTERPWAWGCAVLSACLLLVCLLAACDLRSASMAASTVNPPAREQPMLQRQGDTLIIAHDSPLRQHVKLEEATLKPLHDALSFVASVEAAPESMVRMIAPVSGRIVRLSVQTGDAVKPGQPLVHWHSAHVHALRTDHAKARAVLRQAEQEHGRQKVLFDADIAARRELEAAQQALEAANADVHAAAGALAQLGIALNPAPDPMQDGAYWMHAPIQGQVLSLEAAPGSYWNEGEPLMVIADLRRLWLSAHVPEREIARIAIGQPVRIQFSTQPDLPLTGQVQYIDQVIDPESRSVKVRVAVDNPQGVLRPGMFAHLHFEASPRQAVMVPASALLQGPLHSRVLVQTAVGRFEPRDVQAGAVLGKQVEIRSGLAVGEVVMVNAVEVLQ